MHSQPLQTIADLEFTPNCHMSLPVNSGNDTLLAVGGQEAEIHLSLHTPSLASSSSGISTFFIWQYYHKLQGSINNSIFLTSLSLTCTHEPTSLSTSSPSFFISPNGSLVLASWTP
ncbi:hypothetical protein BDQ17DRAFT_1429656 [Cyathus striatus]|nr:hypothetical protein BDQ17DRAFT_1429656 [Cyathus striatus]